MKAVESHLAVHSDQWDPAPKTKSWDTGGGGGGAGKDWANLDGGGAGAGEDWGTKGFGWDRKEKRLGTPTTMADTGASNATHCCILTRERSDDDWARTGKGRERRGRVCGGKPRGARESKG